MHNAIIGILGIVDNEKNTTIKNTYVNAIEKSGGVPILLPYAKAPESIIAFADICDGFLFSGGVDINPEYYGETATNECGEIQAYRDELEFKVFDAVLPTKKPIMAICRGAQFINVALGGTLYQDIPSQIKTDILHRQSEPKDAPSHTVSIKDGTPLSSLLKRDIITVNSFHHQAIKKLGSGLGVMASSSDGIIEAVYSYSEPYIRAYQWHPELLFEKDDGNRALFLDFIDACRAYRSNRDLNSI